MSVTLDWTGRTVIVVGGTSGINLGVADAFARHGAAVGVASRSQDKVDAAVAQLSKHGAKTDGAAFDVRDPDAVEAGLARLAEALGPFDALVSGAAGNFPAAALDMSPNGFRAVVEIDLLGSYHVARAGYAHLVKPGGALIHISAPQSIVASRMQSHVCAAKAGVDMLTRTLALEWGAAGLRVNSLIPGPIAETEGMARLAPTPQLQELVRKTVPLRRDGLSEDVANAALFLASPLASFVSGAVLPVDGGWSLAGYATVMEALADMMEAAKAR